MVTLDVPIKNNLVNIKRLFSIGIEHEKLGNNADRLVAILHYDAAVEHLLNTILLFFEYQLEKDRNENFSTIWTNVESSLSENKIKFGNKCALPNKREMILLHKTRNNAQHYAMIPDSNSLQHFREIAEKFMVDVVYKIFETDFSQITLAILIKNGEVKKYIEEAEKHLLNGEYKKSIKSSFSAFYVAKSEEQGKIHGSGSMVYRLFSEIRKSKKDGYKEMKFVKKLTDGRDLNISELTDYIFMANELMLKELEIFKLKLDYKKYMQYIRICPDLIISNVVSNEIEIKDKVCNYENAFFCLNFVIDSILKWESFRPQIDNNFIKEILGRC